MTPTHTRAVIQRLGLDGHLINMTVTETFILHSLEVRIQKSTGRVESWRPFIVIGPLIRRGLDTDISLLLGSVNNIVMRPWLLWPQSCGLQGILCPLKLLLGNGHGLISHGVAKPVPLGHQLGLDQGHLVALPDVPGQAAVMGGGVIHTDGADVGLLLRVGGQVPLVGFVLVGLVFTMGAVQSEYPGMGVLALLHLSLCHVSIPTLIAPVPVVSSVNPLVVIQGVFGSQNSATLVAGELSRSLFMNKLDMKLQTVFALETFATNLTRHCGILTNPLIVGLSPMIFVTGFRSTEVAAVITPLGEHCVIVESVVFQRIRHGELLTTILTGQ